MGKTNKNRRLAAKLMFFEGYAQKEIAQLLGCPETTVSRWKKEDKWDKLLDEKNTIQQTNEQYVKKLINYQLKSLDALVDQWESEGTPRLIQKGEIDALSKLYATIKKKDVESTTYVKIVREFMSYLQDENLAMAKKIIPISDNFLNDKRESL